MKKKSIITEYLRYAVASSALLIHAVCCAHPSNVAKVDKTKPPFFTKEFYATSAGQKTVQSSQNRTAEKVTVRGKGQ